MTIIGMNMPSNTRSQPFVPSWRLTRAAMTLGLTRRRYRVLTTEAATTTTKTSHPRNHVHDGAGRNRHMAACIMVARCCTGAWECLLVTWSSGSALVLGGVSQRADHPWRNHCRPTTSEPFALFASQMTLPLDPRNRTRHHQT